MSLIRSALALSALIIAACGTSGGPTAPSGPPTVAPTGGPTSSPGDQPTASAGSSLDPSQSDAGIVGRIKIVNDTRAGRDGTHHIIAVDADGSSCSANFDGETFTAVAWYDDAPDGMLHQMAVRVGIDEIPAADGESMKGIADGRIYADFVSDSGFGGTAYTGDAVDDPRSSSTIDVTRDGQGLTFEFEGVTWDGVDFSGLLLCAEG